MKKIAIVQNDPGVPAAFFHELLTEWQIPLRLLRPDLGEALPDAADAVLLLGGVMGAYDEAVHPFLGPLKEWLRRMLASRMPLLGICLGGQLLADAAGGTVSSNRCGEKGLVEVTLTAAGAADPLFAGVGGRFYAFQWHNDCFTVPPGADHLATSSLCPGQAFRIGNAWGVQFHPEVDFATVCAWCRRDTGEEKLAAQFAAVETAHRDLARRILANFLTAAGVAGR